MICLNQFRTIAIAASLATFWTGSPLAQAACLPLYEAAAHQGIRADFSHADEAKNIIGHSHGLADPNQTLETRFHYRRADIYFGEWARYDFANFTSKVRKKLDESADLAQLNDSNLAKKIAQIIAKADENETLCKDKRMSYGELKNFVLRELSAGIH